MAVQTIVNGINSLLGNLGNTIDFGTTVNYKQGSDAAMNQFVSELKSGAVDAVIFLDSNPVYDHLMGAEIAEGLKKAKLSIAIADRANETASLCTYLALNTHYLESWGDASPKAGYYSLTQPVISNIFNSRQGESSLLTWAGKSSDYQAYVKNVWNSSILNGKTWTQALHDGVYESPNTALAGASFSGNVADAASKVSSIKSSGIELYVFENVTIGTGIQANNPWLQETPDPVSKVTWENTAAFSQKTAADLGLEVGDWVNLTIGAKTVELPILIQPGQANDTVTVAMGYGRTAAGKAGNVGVAMLPLLKGSATASNLWGWRSENRKNEEWIYTSSNSNARDLHGS